MELRFKFWVEEEGRTLFGQGTLGLLENILLFGSIQRAAEEMKMSYRQAWGHLKRTEKRLGLRLVEAKRGGSGGGGTVLTPQGKELLDKLSNFKSVGQCKLEELFRAVFEG